MSRSRDYSIGKSAPMLKSNRLVWILVVIVVLAAIAWMSRGKVLDFAADEVNKRFETSSCEELIARKAEPPSMMKKVALSLLRDDPVARTAFIDKVAAPVLNKMIACGMAP